VNHGGGDGVEEVQADEVESRRARDHAARVQRLALAEDRQIDPGGKAWRISRTPDDVRYVENAAALQEWTPISYADHPGKALDSSSGEIFGLDADER
jgi:hypothetical protein